MRVERGGPSFLLVDFESEEELQEERTNLAVGGLFLRTTEELPPLEVVEVRLRLRGRGEMTVKATVVGTLAGGLALQLEGSGAEVFASLVAAPATAAWENPREIEEATEAAGAGTLWDRVRAMTPPQKMLLAPKADRNTRALLLQDNDPMLLLALLKNPRLGIDEVVRIAKSSSLSYQTAELILKTAQWAGNLDVRVALVHNPKLPLPLALRILPGLPDAELRLIAKGAATSAALKQAALRRVVAG